MTTYFVIGAIIAIAWAFVIVDAATAWMDAPSASNKRFRARYTLITLGLWPVAALAWPVLLVGLIFAALYVLFTQILVDAFREKP